MAALSATAAPLDLAKVSTGSKWLLHLDVDALRNSKIGTHFLNKIIQPKIDEADELKEMKLSLSLQNISSVTAFGPAFAKDGEGVLLVQTSADVKKDLDTVCGMVSVSGGDMLKVTQVNPYPIYSFKSNVFIAPNIGNITVVAKSKEQLVSAREVLLGKGESMSKTKAFTDYPTATNSFFFLGMAEGFNESTAIPPQAQVLKETSGGRLVLGENKDKVFASVVLKAKDDDATLKIQQVFQGIVALVSLSEDNNQLKELASGAKIGAEGRNVTITLQFPIDKAITHMTEEWD